MGVVWVQLLGDQDPALVLFLFYRNVSVVSLVLPTFDIPAPWVLCGRSEGDLRAMVGRFVEVCRRGLKGMQVRAR